VQVGHDERTNVERRVSVARGRTDELCSRVAVMRFACRVRRDVRARRCALSRALDPRASVRWWGLLVGCRISGRCAQRLGPM